MSNDNIIRNFLNALKRQKVFGAFCNKFNLKNSITYFEKYNALKYTNKCQVGNIILINSHTEFVNSLILLILMIKENQYSNKNSLSKLTSRQALWYYAKDYFAQRKNKVKHSLLYYQFLCGTISVIIGLILIFGLIYYFWGGICLLIMVLLTSIYMLITKLFFSKKFGYLKK